MSYLPSRNHGTEIALGNVPDEKSLVKFGRNGDVQAGTVPEDCWAGGGLWTGFDATADEEIRVASGSGSDTGSTISSGTATSGTATTLVDSGADFVITDGVAVGDLLINDTQGIHGYITAVTATTITCAAGMEGDDPWVTYVNSTDSYRVVNATGTGAAVLRINDILDSTWTEQTPVYLVLNGASNVDTSGVDCMRAGRGRVVHSGSGGSNAGILTVRQASTTANIFMAIPVGYNGTVLGCATVPAGEKWVFKRYRGKVVRAAGAAAAITAHFARRPANGSTFQPVRIFEFSTTGGGTGFEDYGGEVFLPGDDIALCRVTAVSATVAVEVAVEFIRKTI